MASRGKHPQWSRRAWLDGVFLGGAALFLPDGAHRAWSARMALGAAAPKTEPFFSTRGVVIRPPDIRNWPWPEKAHEAGLTTIGTHVFPHEVQGFLVTDEGQRFLEECRALGLHVEHELHAINDLLPRNLFDKDPSLFRMDENGERVRDYNLCVHSEAAVALACENAVKFARTLRPTTGRYFYWIDDGEPMCRCPKCRPYSDSDQALLLENAMLNALRREDSTATLAHLAYAKTMDPPTQVKPEPGIFLEFAPIQRRFDVSMGDGLIALHSQLLEQLDANLALFGADGAQALEYWLDESLFYRAHHRTLTKIPWENAVFEQDVAVYAKRGIRHITTFAVLVDRDYVDQFGEPPLDAYGHGLEAYRG
ncbi:MAG TPA: DUF4838 domain-containing protein [Candidatus Hydrogenedentes bacterium]|nr:DUF4838 domain-containing protein [Candidatus Hydrogenedentota bacterium]HPG70349.1 DUF4838 domain-containing protein [Candidatus Hydrogenedentota bacterium]